jgi:hypothetical protein
MMKVLDGVDVEGFIAKLFIPEQKKMFRLVVLWRAKKQTERLVLFEPLEE